MSLGKVSVLAPTGHSTQLTAVAPSRLERSNLLFSISMPVAGAAGGADSPGLQERSALSAVTAKAAFSRRARERGDPDV